MTLEMFQDLRKHVAETAAVQRALQQDVRPAPRGPANNTARRKVGEVVRWTPVRSI